MYIQFLGLIVIFAVSMTSGFSLNVTSADTRIVGGNQADIKDHKHLVSLMFKGSHICGGSLLSSQHVVTAAHCLQLDPTNPSVYTVRAGSSNKVSGGTVQQVKTIWMHPDYNKQTIENDIAILKLSKAVSGSLIKPIALPKTQIDAGLDAIVAGWGATDVAGTKFPDILRSVPVTIVGKTKCTSIRPDLKRSMLCAIKSGKGPCIGDSGGSMAKDGIIYGIVSFGRECGSSTYPAVYANIMKLKDFIEPKLKL